MQAVCQFASGVVNILKNAIFLRICLSFAEWRPVTRVEIRIRAATHRVKMMALKPLAAVNGY